MLGTYRSGNTELCIIWKVGTTFVKRLFMMKELPKYKNVVNPYEIRFDADLQGSRSTNRGMSLHKLMFVRDPYQRLVSGYVDKLLAPNPVYWKILSIRAIRLVREKPTAKSLQCGHDLEFHEYIKYVIKSLDNHRGAKADGHFNIQTEICGPCRNKYEFVGKMEQFGVDSWELIKRLNFSNETVESLRENGSRLASDDAIRDSCNQPFDPNFVKLYKRCISFYEALQRAWFKMQTRGLIGPEELPVTEKEAQTLTLDKFVQLAMASRDSCPSGVRKKQQHDHFLKFFSSVSKSDLEKIRNIYAEDFKLYEYNDRPPELFN